MRNVLIVLVIFGVFVLSFFGLWGMRRVWVNRNGYCGSVGLRPQVVSGRIRGINHGLRHTLYYPGVYEISGKRCQYAEWVTKAEYDRYTRTSKGD